MNFKNTARHPAAGPKKVLIAPLDWGLGHATRCIPIIRGLLHRGHQVFLAASGDQKNLLQAEFKALPMLPLQGYNIQYGASAVQTVWRLLGQIPQISRAIRQEHRWLAAAMEEHHFDVVLSDNRYGLYHPQVKSILMTHQLCIQAPVGKRAIQQVHYRLMAPFSECWVPDAPEGPNLGGALSHPQKLPPVPVRYIGPLSRFEKKGPPTSGQNLLLLLSGPEPQRTIFEQLLVKQLGSLSIPVVLVRGLPGGGAPLALPPGVQVHNHLPAHQLQAAIEKAAFVVCRSGYSTVMDLAALGKRSILVPTPGQTEQLYLARHLAQQGFAMGCTQKNFSLAAALQAAGHFAYRQPPPTGNTLLHTALNTLNG